ncbi:hypothetical protein I6N91_11050 [Arthrobacter sp. MSA 4-2]|uniref:hypothetical protein n=1 Tax=Arthrobacter sp. MSA 4-2 TaxID=2794349 RepID=UPI001A255BF1|nr:hypothetical protein [Arthrobacter sp. MSA 4-2]MBJ2121514.1 hypothetical protein [Arthrobacter sp. MSA 4-2]
MNSRLSPADPFPVDLSVLTDADVEVLNSKVQRQLGYEFVSDGLPDPETEFRAEELTEELDRRDAGALAAAAPAAAVVDGRLRRVLGVQQRAVQSLGMSGSRP